MVSSIQSVAGQPVAAPEPIPRHHGVWPLLRIRSVSSSSSGRDFGSVYPARVKACFG